MTEAKRNQRQRYRRKHPEKITAKKQVHNAVKNGLLVKPPWCSWCGREGHVDGHHVNYAQPLNVVWICRPCHDALHVKINTQGRFGERIAV